MLPFNFNLHRQPFEYRGILEYDSEMTTHLAKPENRSGKSFLSNGQKWILVWLLTIFSSEPCLHAQSTGTDLNPRQFENRAQPIRRKDLVPPERARIDATLIDAFVDQYDYPRSVDTLRTLQRAYRIGGNKNAGCLEEILRLSNILRLRNEFIRFAELGCDEALSDRKIVLRAAVSLTDSRKYSVAAKFYDQWLRISSNERASYLSVIVLIEKGRLNYLAREYKSAETAFQSVLEILESDLLDENQKKQILRNSETTYRMMANTFLKTKDFDRARKLFDLAGIDSTSPIQFLNEAQIAFATGKLDAADQLVHQFIAKQPNNSESYRLLQKLYLRRNPTNEGIADQKFVADLEKIRQKFETGKVLDDFLVTYYLKLERTGPAKEILRQQRSETLWRDRANRLLIEIAFRDKNLENLMQALIIETDEHESLGAIRTTLKKNADQLDGWEKAIRKFLVPKEPVVRQLSAACLLLYRKDREDADAWKAQLIDNISQDRQSSRLRRIKLLSLLGREAVTQKQYRLALSCFEKCLELNRAVRDEWMDQRTAFDSLMSSVFVHCRLEQPSEAAILLKKAEEILRYSPSLMHMQGWAKLQFADLKGAIVDYESFLTKFDKSGASRSLASLIERVRLEMAFAFFLMDKPELASEVVNQILDRNPFGPDLEAFQRNNQKYIEKKKLFLEFANGVKNGGPFTLGRN